MAYCASGSSRTHPGLWALGGHDPEEVDAWASQWIYLKQD